jgi:hypothetical protein
MIETDRWISAMAGTYATGDSRCLYQQPDAESGRVYGTLTAPALQQDILSRAWPE